MAAIPRKKSPRAPSIPLDEALDRALKAYDKERLHATPTDVVAQNIGYKGANNGAALSAIASLRYYGLLERPKEGFLAVSKDVESFRFAPSEDLRKSLLMQFVRNPPIFAELLDNYASGLPSDANLKHELIIQRGFAPATAETALLAFRRSVDFAGYFDTPTVVSDAGEDADEEKSPSPIEADETVRQPTQINAQVSATNSTHPVRDEDCIDRIPVRLTGGRRAWLLIPTPLFSADKVRLKAQIDLLLTEDESDQ